MQTQTSLVPEMSSLESEQLRKALHSAQFLQNDLHLVLAKANPMLAEVMANELDDVNRVVARLQGILSIESTLRSSL
jgi:hypothetical protein